MTDTTNALIQNIDTCLRTRELGVASLIEVLQAAKTSTFSEKQLAELWLAKTTSDPNLMDKGWYEPPPNGFSVLTADDRDPNRLSFASLRVTEKWSKPDIFYAPDKPTFFYCSPVDKATGMIGDFSVTLYNGTDQNVSNYIKLCYDLGNEIAEYAQIGMKISEVYEYAMNAFKRHRVNNDVYSVTDQNYFNVGHTIPWTNEPMTDQEQSVLTGGDWNKVKNMISKKREFVNSAQNLVIPDNIIFTIEPRLVNIENPSLPTPTFHHLVVCRDGKKTVVNQFSSIFAQLGMGYMLS